MKKRPLNVFVSLVSAGTMTAVSTLSAFPQIVYAEGSEFKVTDDYFKYEVNEDDTIIILGRTKGEYEEDKLVIPSKIEGKPVTIIGKDAFRGTDYSELVLPDTVVEIEEYAFQNTDLISVEIPDSVKKIGYKAFTECDDITSVTLTPFIEEIKGSAFSYSDSLEYVYIPNMPALETDDDYAAWFHDSGLKKVELADGITKLPAQLFSTCDELTELIWSDDLEIIGKKTFSGCGFTEMIIPESVKEISEYAFSNCIFTELTLPEGLKIIGRSAFSECDNLISFEIPPEVEEIGSRAFGYMDSLEELYIPNIPAVQNNKFYESLYHSGLKKIEFADDITVIPERMCSGCEQLEEIIWSDSLEEICDYAFSDCISLKDPKLPEGLKKIYSYAFTGCTGIINVDLPLSIEDLGYRPFNNTTSLKYLYVPKQFPSTSGKYAGGSAFMNSGIKKLVFADGITEINDTFSDLPELTEVVIPDSVTKLDYHAFDGCSSLSEIDLPKNLKEIEWLGVFGKCENLREIKIPASVESATYFSSPVLEVVEFEDGMTKIPYRFLTGCNTLKKVIIPDSVTEIGKEAFSGCTTLSIIEGANNENIVVEEDAFKNCNNLWDSRFSYFERGGLSIQKSVNGDVENYTVHYSINPIFRDNFESLKFHAFVSQDVEVIKESIVVDDYETGRSSFECTLNEPDDTIRFSLRNPERIGYAVTSPEISVRMKNGNVNIQSNRGILSSSAKSSVLSITVPKTAVKTDGTSTFNVFGNALLNKDVRIFVDDELYKTVTSSRYTGKFSTDVTYKGDADSVKVKAVWDNVKTDEYTVKFTEDDTEIVSVYFGHDNTHHYVHEDITDTFLDGYSPVIPYNPDNPVDFEVKLSNNDNTEGLYVVSETDGEDSAIELIYDEKTDSWKGEGFFDTAVPGDLSVRQVPKNVGGTLVSERKGDKVSVKIKDSDFEIAPENNKTGDIVKEFVEKTGTKVVAQSNNAVLVRSDLSKISDDIPEGKGNLNIYQGTVDKIWLEGEYHTVAEIAKSPENYGFIKSGFNYINEDGEKCEYFFLSMADSDTAKETATKISFGTDFKDFSNVAEYLMSNPVNTDIIGTLMIEANVDKDTVQGVCEFSNEFSKSTNTNLATGLLGEALEDIAKEAGQTTSAAMRAANGAGVGIAAATSAADIITASNQYEMYMEQLENSQNPLVKKNIGKYETAIKTVFAGRVLVAATGTITAAGLIGFPLLPALAIGAVAFLSCYILNKCLDRVNSFLWRELAASGKLGYLLDPSGYAYGVDKDDRIEGATATIYYKDENGEAVKWNAVDYDQKNPQITDSAGWYAWDVPEGEWKVVVEKEGYRTAESEWLSVLPVQTNVNLQLIENASQTTTSVTTTTSITTTETLTTTTSQPVEYKLGDVNNDGRIDAVDASTVLAYYAMISTNKDGGFDDNQKSAADVDHDGMINAVDASNILAYYAYVSTTNEKVMSMEEFMKKK